MKEIKHIGNIDPELFESKEDCCKRIITKYPLAKYFTIKFDIRGRISGDEIYIFMDKED